MTKRPIKIAAPKATMALMVAIPMTLPSATSEFPIDPAKISRKMAQIS